MNTVFPHQLQLTMALATIPPVFKRKRHALILLRNAQGDFILGEKKHYPKGIVRMVGGGLDEFEDPHAGAARELTEETGLLVVPDHLIPLAEIKSELSEPSGNIWSFVTYLFLYELNNQQIRPQDDVDGLIEITPAQFQELVSRFETLSEDMHPEMKFRWSDYGKLYGKIHQLAFDLAREIPLK